MEPRYVLTEKDRKDITNLPSHIRGEFVASFCENILKQKDISIKQYLILQSLRHKRSIMYKMPAKRVTQRDRDLHEWGYMFEASDYGGYYG